MANEITLNATFEFEKGNIKLTFRPGSHDPSVSGQYVLNSVQQIGTSAYEGLGTGDCSSGGYGFFYNVSTSTTTDPTLHIARSDATSTPFMKLLPGDYAIIRNETVALSAKGESTSANASLHYAVIDP